MKTFTFHIGEGDFVTSQGENVEEAKGKILVEGKPLRPEAIEYVIDNDGYQYVWQEDEWLTMKTY